MANGVELRPTSIRLKFVFEGKTHKPTLMLNGEPVAPTPANVKYATRLGAEIRERIKHGTFSMVEYFPASGTGATATTVAGQLDTWLASQRITDSTRNGYKSAATFWKGAIGDKALRALKTSDVLIALNTRATLSGKTVNNYVSVLREAVALALLDELVSENVVENVPRAKHQKPPVDPFTLEEAEAIIADMAAHYSPQVANYVTAKFFMGLRTGESFGLRWPDVELRDKRVTISGGVVQGKEVVKTKTNVARQVLLNSRALAALTDQRAHTFLAQGHVFHDPRYGVRWAGERAFGRSFWKPTLARLQMRYREPYNTRHTYATMMLMSGMKPGFCAGQMGHSVEIFHSTYAKWIPGAGDMAEMAKLEETLAPQTSPKSPQKVPRP